MTAHLFRTAIAVALLFGLTRSAAAQAWDSPSFATPGPQDDIGLYLIHPDAGDLGIVALWRQSGGRFDIGLRAGMGGESGDRTALVGADFAGHLLTRGGAQPFSVSWVAGAGASFDGTTWFRLPAGLSVGLGIPGPSFTIMPWIHPRLALDIFSFDTADGDDTDTELNADLDFGVDLTLGTSWTIRGGYTSGHVDTFGVGVAYRIPRSVEVR